MFTLQILRAVVCRLHQGAAPAEIYSSSLAPGERRTKLCGLISRCANPCECTMQWQRRIVRPPPQICICKPAKWGTLEHVPERPALCILHDDIQVRLALVGAEHARVQHSSFSLLPPSRMQPTDALSDISNICRQFADSSVGACVVRKTWRSVCERRHGSRWQLTSSIAANCASARGPYELRSRSEKRSSSTCFACLRPGIGKASEPRKKSAYRWHGTKLTYWISQYHHCCSQTRDGLAARPPRRRLPRCIPEANEVLPFALAMRDGQSLTSKDRLGSAVVVAMHARNGRYLYRFPRCKARDRRAQATVLQHRLLLALHRGNL